MAAVPTGSAWAAGPVAFAQLWPGPSSCVDLTPGPRQPGASPAHVMHSQRDAWPRQPPPPPRPPHTPPRTTTATATQPPYSKGIHSNPGIPRVCERAGSTWTFLSDHPEVCVTASHLPGWVTFGCGVTFRVLLRWQLQIWGVLTQWLWGSGFLNVEEGKWGRKGVGMLWSMMISW